MQEIYHGRCGKSPPVLRAQSPVQFHHWGSGNREAKCDVTCPSVQAHGGPLSTHHTTHATSLTLPLPLPRTARRTSAILAPMHFHKHQASFCLRALHSLGSPNTRSSLTSACCALPLWALKSLLLYPCACRSNPFIFSPSFLTASTFSGILNNRLRKS